MIRYYTVEGDLDNGYDFEYLYYHYYDALEKYRSINGVPFKTLRAYDDKQGDITLEREER